MPTTFVTSNNPAGRVALDLFREVYDRARFDDLRARRLHENGDKLKAELATLLEKLSAPSRFAKEEVRSNLGYPRLYSALPLADQVGMLAEIFRLSVTGANAYIRDVLPRLKLPEGAEGWFAIPSVDAVAKRAFSEVTDPAEKYCRCVELVMRKLDAACMFKNCRTAEMTPRRLRRDEQTARALAEIAGVQTGDILIIPAQFGKRHAGRSIRRAREVFGPDEFGLGAFEGGCMLLTNPDREQQWEQLHMDLPGDVFDNLEEPPFAHAPSFRFRDGRLEFDVRWYSNAFDNFGAVSGFIPR